LPVSHFSTIYDKFAYMRSTLDHISIEARFASEMGRNIEAKRKQRQMNQETLGEAIGVHRNTICRWESGDCVISIWELLRLADILSCNHLLLLPSREYTWGPDLHRAVQERDGRMRKSVQSERDPAITARERAY
jgi:DNA-binding XRE family transcriptional regulator